MDLKLIVIVWRLCSGSVVVTDASQLGLNLSTWDLSVWSLCVFPVHAWVLSVFLTSSHTVPQSKDIHTEWIGDCPVSICCSFLYVGPVIDWQPVQDVCHPHPM